MGKLAGGAALHTRPELILGLIGIVGEALANSELPGITPILAGVLNILGTVLTSVAFALACLGFWICCKHFRLKHLIALIILAFFSACLLLWALQTFKGTPVSSVFPAFDYLLLWLIQKRYPFDSAETNESDFEFKLANKNSVGDFLIGGSLGLFLLVYPFDMFSSSTLILIVIALFIAAGLSLATRKIQKQSPNDALFEIGIPIVAFSWVCCAIGLPPEVFVITQFVGLGYSIFVDQTLLIVMADEYSIPPDAIVYNGAFLALGIATGLYAVVLLDAHTQLIAPLSIFVLLIACTLLVKDRQLKFGWVSMPIDPMDMSRDFFRYACTLIGNEYHLTKREQEVFLRIATGQTRSGISNELHISEETVKSHVKNIYRKIDIHSRQDAIELVQAKAESLVRR
ncbi:MAG: helix-turn-helix transcriptional regulator [Coriobacteriales bacterium]|jgi:DNA-binding CsgD family transcriptional regulator